MDDSLAVETGRSSANESSPPRGARGGGPSSTGEIGDTADWGSPGPASVSKVSAFLPMRWAVLPRREGPKWCAESPSTPAFLIFVRAVRRMSEGEPGRIAITGASFSSNPTPPTPSIVSMLAADSKVRGDEKQWGEVSSGRWEPLSSSRAH